MRPFAIKSLDHLVLRTADPDRLIRFYSDVLGCTEERRLDKIGLVQLRAGASLIDILDAIGAVGRMGGPPPGRNGRNLDHFCVEIEGWDERAIIAWLTAHKVEIGESGTRYGARGDGPSLYIKDPDGNTVELKGPAIPADPGPVIRTLVTKRLMLRPLAVDDAETLHEVFADPESMRYWSTPPHESIHETRTMFRRYVGVADPTTRMWAITTDGGRALGWISLYDQKNRIAGLGYILHAGQRGRGYIRESLPPALAYAFVDWKLLRLFAHIDPRNDASIAAIEGAGFKREGHTRGDFLLNGEYCDTLHYGLLADEWRGGAS